MERSERLRPFRNWTIQALRGQFRDAGHAAKAWKDMMTRPTPLRRRSSNSTPRWLKNAFAVSVILLIGVLIYALRFDFYRCIYITQGMRNRYGGFTLERAGESCAGGSGRASVMGSRGSDHRRSIGRTGLGGFCILCMRSVQDMFRWNWSVLMCITGSGQNPMKRPKWSGEWQHS